MAAKPKKAKRGRHIELGGAALAELVETARTHKVHLQATATIVDEVMRQKFQWARATPTGVEWAPEHTAPPIPDWCSAFVHDAVESIVIAGYFAYIKSPGGTWATVVPPETYTIVSTAQNPSWVARDKKLLFHAIDPPRQTGIRSAVVRAMNDTQRYDALEKHILERDRLNSHHTVFTVISKDVKNQNGSSRQWFRSSIADESAGSRPRVDTDFSNLLARRRETVEKLAQNTVYQNSTLGASRQGIGAFHGRTPPVASAMHKEHAVTDGREYGAAPQLQSLTDGKAELDRVYTNIMLAFHVPPQIFGKNINTERHAASNRLTESAVSMFWRRAAHIRTAIGLALKDITIAIDEKSHVAFRIAPGIEALTAIGPALTPSFAKKVASDVYGVAPASIQADKLMELLGHAHGLAPTAPADSGGSAAVVNGHSPSEASKEDTA